MGPSSAFAGACDATKEEKVKKDERSGTTND
jgi:hypothetical protein